MPFLVFLGRGQNVLLCFLMDLMSPPPGISNEWSLTPHLHALKNWHGTPNVWHRADDFKARHSQFSTCKRIGPKCNVAPLLKFLGVQRLLPGGSLGTGKRLEVRCQKFGVPC